MAAGSAARRFGASALVLMGGCASAAAGQMPVGREVGIQAFATLAAPSFAGGALSVAWRPGGRTRLALLAAAGARDGSLAARGEALLHYLIAPNRRRGLGFYGLGGLAGVTGRGDAAYLVLGLGVESAPGGRSGWMLEGGVGGGVRLSAGWRYRWLHRSAPPP
jgi:hypothetical protein